MSQSALIDVVIRHPRERKSKCSLEPLRDRPDLCFHTANPGFSFDGTGFLLLEIGAPPIGPDDARLPILLLDGTWRLLPALRKSITGCPVPRSLPGNFVTAYPRRSKISPDPRAGLASVEALYLARSLQCRPTEGLLHAYLWRDAFLSQFAS